MLSELSQLTSSIASVLDICDEYCQVVKISQHSFETQNPLVVDLGANYCFLLGFAIVMPSGNFGITVTLDGNTILSTTYGGRKNFTYVGCGRTLSIQIATLNTSAPAYADVYFVLFKKLD